MGLLETLFDTAGRRKRQAEDLREKIAALEVEHSSAVVGADDGAADKIFAKLEKLRADLRAVQAAIDAAEQHTASTRQSIAAERQAQLERDFEASLHDTKAAALAFEEKVLEAAELYCAYQATQEASRLKSIAAHIVAADVSVALKPMQVFNVAMLQFISRIQPKDASPIRFPDGGSRSRHFPSLAERLASEEKAMEAQQ